MNEVKRIPWGTRYSDLDKATKALVRMEYGTPWPLFNALHRLCAFQLDAMASAENAKCKRYFTKEQNALNKSWITPTIKRVFCNPPFCMLAKVMEKAWGEWMSDPEAVIAVVTPVDFSTKWFRDWGRQAHTILLLTGSRVEFDAPRGVVTSRNPLQTMVLLFREDGPHPIRGPRIHLFDWTENDDETVREAV